MRRRPVVLATLLLGAAAYLALALLDADVPTVAILPATALVALAASSYSGREAWTAGAACLAWLASMYLILDEHDIGLAMLTIPGFLAGTAFRLRRETAEELELRGRELEEERELFAHLAVRNERARIAAELHDIIGHSLSVMVVQAAAGQRLVQLDPDAGGEVLGIIDDAAQQGRADLHRLVDLLGGAPVVAPDLDLVEELVARAARMGMQVSCRFEGDRDGVPAAAAALGFQVVRESLTNALRHAPGAPVRVLLCGAGRRLQVEVLNDPPRGDATRIQGTGQGLRGLRERVEEHGGTLVAGPRGGGWSVRADL
ncbi:hypothetical protein D9V37_09495 [Nocardioides mangrovicus]|uniref:histidine kinase n=1 Tax=Nocardioides mangrovicus TaxID=2478913 RepID=A0A3L8P1Y1_9ACTN|nr:histidine kinase [Nocardioides mangrovicus]RLV48833.1 hypothetical protein D9V37_09495 [Nocardioides mangrovicus]